MLCVGGSLKVIRGKKQKADRCQKIYLELRPIRSRSNPFSQTSRSTRKLWGNQLLIKSDSITSPQEVTNESHSTEKAENMYDSNERGNFLNLCAFILGWSSSSNLHKSPKNANIFDEENTDASDDLFRWSLDHEGIPQGDTLRKGCGNFRFAKVRLCVK